MSKKREINPKCKNDVEFFAKSLFYANYRREGGGSPFDTLTLETIDKYIRQAKEILSKFTILVELNDNTICPCCPLAMCNIHRSYCRKEAADE